MSAPAAGTKLPSCHTAPILETALSMLRVAKAPPAKVADLPCGTGYLSVRAMQEGYDVHPYDIEPKFWEGGEERKAAWADLNARLPIDDGAFDALVCCEGFEHIENPWHTLRELKRVLKPGGTLVVSIPNTIDIRQRWRIYRRGFPGHYPPAVPGHINAMGAYMLCFALIRTGFRIRALGAPKAYGGPLMAALVPFFGIGKDCGLPEDVRAMLSSKLVLCGRTLIAVATT